MALADIDLPWRIRPVRIRISVFAALGAAVFLLGCSTGRTPPPEPPSQPVALGEAPSPAQEQPTNAIRYFSRRDMRDFMDLCPDGTFLVHRHGATDHSGRYTIRSSALLLTTSNGVSLIGWLDDRLLRQADGRQWIRPPVVMPHARSTPRALEATLPKDWLLRLGDDRYYLCRTPIGPPPPSLPAEAVVVLREKGQLDDFATADNMLAEVSDCTIHLSLAPGGQLWPTAVDDLLRALLPGYQPAHTPTSLAAMLPHYAPALPPTNSFRVVFLDREPDACIRTAPFYFISLYVEDVVFCLDLHKRLDDDDLLLVGESLYTSITNGVLTQWRIPRYQGQSELTLAFKPLLQGGTLHLLVISNYQKDTRAIVEGTNSIADCWAVGYSCQDEKLVRIHPHGEETGMHEQRSKTDMANSFLFDGQADNDAQIERLLLEDIHEGTAEFPSFSRVVLCQYYMSIGHVDKAEAVLVEAKRSVAELGSEEKISNMDDMLRLTGVELTLLMRLIGHGTGAVPAEHVK